MEDTGEGAGEIQQRADETQSQYERPGHFAFEQHPARKSAPKQKTDSAEDTEKTAVGCRFSDYISDGSLVIGLIRFRNNGEQ